MRDSIKQEVPNIEQNPKYEDFYGLPQAATSAGIEANNISKKERKNGGGGGQCVGTKRVVLYCEERMGWGWLYYYQEGRNVPLGTKRVQV